MKELSFEDYEEFLLYKQKLTTGKYIKAKQQKLHPDSQFLKYDLITSGGLYMSTALKAAYDKAGMSGLRFKKETFL